jgi:hypothetical protein
MVCDEMKQVSYAEVFSKKGKPMWMVPVLYAAVYRYWNCYEIPIIRAESSAIHCKNQERISVANPDPVLFDP